VFLASDESLAGRRLTRGLFDWSISALAIFRSLTGLVIWFYIQIVDRPMPALLGHTPNK
jgi:hypothetical protein